VSDTTNIELWSAIDDAIYANIVAATQSGGPLAVQSNPDGTTGIQHIARVAPPTQKLFPSVGVMCLSYDEVISGSAKHDFTATWAIVVTVQQPFDPTIDDIGETAMTLLRAYQDDGSGNGISPLLRGNVTVNGIAQWSQITAMERHPLEGKTSEDMIATAIYTFEVHYSIKIAPVTVPAPGGSGYVNLTGQGFVDTGSPGGLQTDSSGIIDSTGSEDWEIDATNGALVSAVNGGKIFLGPDFPFIDGSNAGSYLTADGGTVQIGVGSGDSCEVSFGISAVGTIHVYGKLKLSGFGSLEVGGAGDGTLVIGALGEFDLPGDADVLMQGNLTIESLVSVPPDIATLTDTGGVLAMFTHTEVGLAAAFSDSSFLDGSLGEITAWAWDFGDSSGTSTDQNPDYTYAAGGTYNVSLTVTTAGGGSSQGSAQVTVA
jgi:hypothetical protein